MTFDEAIAEIETYCPTDGAPSDAASHLEVLSGGFRKSPGDPVPALYATRELAIEAWLDTMLEMISDQEPTSIAFTDGPHLDKHIMTNQTERGTQRSVEDRFSVASTVGLINPKAS